MALVIVATPGSATANSFVSLAEWTTYMESRLNDGAFTDADDDTKNRALAEATRELTALFYDGERTTETQVLAWPRDSAPDPDAPFDAFGAEVDFDDDVIPERIKRATYELAFAFLKAGTTDLASLEPGLEVKRKKLIDVLGETEWFPPGDRVRGLARFPAVMREIRPLLSHATYGNEVVRS
jgi:hypothetical protein